MTTVREDSLHEEQSLYIDGAWTAPSSDGSIPVENPATEEIFATVPEGSEQDVDEAVGAARGAFEGWSSTPPEERARLVAALSEHLASNVEETAWCITSEVGTPIRISRRIQAALPVTDLELGSRYAAEFPSPERVGNSLVVREPVGVVAAITPWNYPLHQITAKLAPALAAGCTVVVKPSELAPLTAFMLCRALDEVGFPPGVVNLVTGYGTVVGEALVSHDQVDAVTFTGSLATGTRVAELASAGIKRVTLELGGKSANVVLDDADLASAVKVGVSNAFLNAGQTCTAWTRLLVPRARHDEAVELAAGYAAAFTPSDPTSDSCRLGPLVSRMQLTRVRDYIARGSADGAELVCGGGEAPADLERGYFVRPTVFANVDPDAVIAQEEIFGPVLCVIPFDTDHDALSIANNSRFGLHGSVWSGDQERALAFARGMRTGQVDVNGAAFNPEAPFGGYKGSGIGREAGRAALDEFLETKAIQLPATNVTT